MSYTSRLQLMSSQNVLVRVPVVSEPPPTTEKGEASAIWPRPKRHGSGKGYFEPLAPMPVKSYRAEYSHSSLNICSSWSICSVWSTNIPEQDTAHT